MAPPLTGFFMKAVGLGEAHKQIEAEKRERNNAADRREFNRYRMQKLQEERYLTHLADVEARSNGTGPPSRSDARNQHFANELPISSTPSRDARRAANGPRHSTRGSTLGAQSSSQLPRFHRYGLSLDTLAEYEIPWHWDKKDKNYIIIDMPFGDPRLGEFLRHMSRHLEQLELNGSAVGGMEERGPEMRRGRDPEQGSMRGLQDHVRGRARVPRSEAHMNARQADYVRSAPKDLSPPRKSSKALVHVPQEPDEMEMPAPKIRSPIPHFQEVPPNPRHGTQSSAGAGLHSRSTRQQYPEEYTLDDQHHQASFQTHRSHHRARHSQAPFEQPLGRSASMARQGYARPAAENTRPLPLRSARGPVQHGRARAPSMREPEPRWEKTPRSASIARGERGYSVAGTAGQFPSQRSRGPMPLGRERGFSSVRGSESRRGFPPTAGSLFEDGGERGRRRGDRERFA
ncbi:hypothetical protein BDR22DRAFT_966250 [Usnea florida]